MARKSIIAVDLFCGIGGTSTGLLQAAEDLSLDVQLTAVNHWKTAVDSHTLNHPNVKHLCEDVETLYPRDVVPGGRLHLLVASCECTFFSMARGGGPCNEQSRSQVWQIIRWITDLHVDAVMLENVREFMSFGPLLQRNTRIAGKIHKKLTPDPRRKGEYFRNFIKALEDHGYSVEYKVQNCADYGDPTKRQRFILMARRDNAPITWPTQTHADPAKIVAGQLPWLTARDHVIDWSLEGKSIFNRKKPLSQNTIRRIAAGLAKFGGPAAEPFLVMLRGLSEAHINASPSSVDGPIRTLTAGGTHVGLVEPFMLGQQSCAAPRGVSEPTPTVATAGAISLTEAVIKPLVLPQFSGAIAKPVDAPLGAITTDGGPALVDAVVVQSNHGTDSKKRGTDSKKRGTDSKKRGTDARRAKSVKYPLCSVTGQSGLALAEAVMVNMKGQSNGADTKEPMPTITAHAAHMAVVEPLLIPVNYGERKGQQTRTCDLKDPMPTVVGRNTHGVVQPVITHCTHHGNRPQHSVDDPLPTVTAAHRGELALAQPVVIQTDQTGSNGMCAQSVDRPLVTVVGRCNMAVVEPVVVTTDQTGPSKKNPDAPVRPAAQLTNTPLKTVVSKQNMGLVEPLILPKEGFFRGNTPKSVDQPLVTVTGSDGTHLVQPMLVKFYGTGTAVSMDAPLDTVTTKDRFLLVCPKTGEVQAELDIRFRMLQPHELAAAHSFPKNYKFTGNKGDATKMVGNSVPVQLARAHTRAALQGIIEA